MATKIWGKKMKYCSTCGEKSLPTMVMCAACGNRNFSDLPSEDQKIMGTEDDGNQDSPAKDSTTQFPAGQHGTPIVPNGWLELPVTPWRRYGARILDLSFFGAIAFGIIGFIYYSVAPYSADQFFNVFNQPSARILDIILTTLLGTILTGAVIGVSGTSLGKLIFGIIVTDTNGHKLGFVTGIQRDFAVYLRGLALGIPIVSLITLYNAYSRLNKSNMTSWDQESGYKVWHRPSGSKQYLLNTIGILLILAINAASRAM